MSDPTVPYGNHQFEIYLRGLNGERPALPTTYDGLEARAREELSPEAFAYVAGGAGEGRTMRANRDAFDRHALAPRMLRGVDAATSRRPCSAPRCARR